MRDTYARNYLPMIAERAVDLSANRIHEFNLKVPIPIGTAELHHFLVAIFTLLRSTQLNWTKRRRNLREGEMDALADQGLSPTKELRGRGAVRRAWGKELPPDSLGGAGAGK
eukprot:2780209-Alexandrium_andersonii.AAC.1